MKVRAELSHQLSICVNISVVEWINFLTPLKISRAQLQAFRMIDDDYQKDILDNFRPPQPLNGRTVRFWA